MNPSRPGRHFPEDAKAIRLFREHLRARLENARGAFSRRRHRPALFVAISGSLRVAGQWAAAPAASNPLAAG